MFLETRNLMMGLDDSNAHYHSGPDDSVESFLQPQNPVETDSDEPNEDMYATAIDETLATVDATYGAFDYEASEADGSAMDYKLSENISMQDLQNNLANLIENFLLIGSSGEADSIIITSPDGVSTILPIARIQAGNPEELAGQELLAGTRVRLENRFRPEIDGISSINEGQNGNIASINTTNLSGREQRYNFQDRLETDLSAFQYSFINTQNGSFMAVNTRGGHFVDTNGEEVNLAGNVNFMPITDPTMIEQLDTVREEVRDRARAEAEAASSLNPEQGSDSVDSEGTGVERVPREPNAKQVILSGIGEAVLPYNSQEPEYISAESIPDLEGKLKEVIPMRYNSLEQLGVEVTTTGQLEAYEDQIDGLVRVLQDTGLVVSLDDDGQAKIDINVPAGQVRSNLAYAMYYDSSREDQALNDISHVFNDIIVAHGGVISNDVYVPPSDNEAAA